MMNGKTFQQGVFWDGGPGFSGCQTVELVRQHSDSEHWHESAIRGKVQCFRTGSVTIGFS